MKKTALKALFALSTALTITSCVTNEPAEEKVLSTSAQDSALGKMKSPRYFGYQAFPVRDGIAFVGEAHLHPNHLARAPFLEKETPVIAARGVFKRQSCTALVDFSAPNTWMEFDAADDFETTYLGIDGQSIPYRGGYSTGAANAYAGVVNQLRIDQLFIENVPLYVRMARNSMGPLARGITEPEVDAVIGWDILKLFEYVQLDYRADAMLFSATIPYIPHEDLVMSTAKIVKLNSFGLCVKGAINGQSTPIVLDLSSKFDFARCDKNVSSTTQVSIGDLVYRDLPTQLLPANSSPPRIGRELLKRYLITVCPLKKIVYFERYPEDD